MAAVRQSVEINAPEHLTRRERVRDTLLTAMLWAFYFYLWVPLASLFAWLLGIELAYDVMIRAGGLRGLEAEVRGYVVVIGIILVSVTAWSLGNRYRFRGRRDRRRHATHTISDADLARYFEVGEMQVAQLRAGRRVDIVFRDDAPGGSAISVRPRG